MMTDAEIDRAVYNKLKRDPIPFVVLAKKLDYLNMGELHDSLARLAEDEKAAIDYGFGWRRTTRSGR